MCVIYPLIYIHFYVLSQVYYFYFVTYYTLLWQVMEKLRSAILPEVFTVIKVTKSTLEFLRFDAEIENRKNLPQVISKIDQKVSVAMQMFSICLFSLIRSKESTVLTCYR